jgi:hypothetical protein
MQMLVHSYFYLGKMVTFIKWRLPIIVAIAKLEPVYQELNSTQHCTEKNIITKLVQAYAPTHQTTDANISLHTTLLVRKQAYTPHNWQYAKPTHGARCLVATRIE